MDAQFKKGVLVLLILKVIKEKDTYGYELVMKINKGIEVKEGTVYPILRRLTNEKLLSTYMKESDQGPARKYYSLTDEGLERYYDLKKQWKYFVNSTERILNGESDD